MMQVLQRVVRVLEQVAAAPGTAGVRELAQLTGLPTATCGRLLHDLAAIGWVESRGRRGFRLGPALPALAAARPYAGRLVAATQAPLIRLTRRHRARGSVAVLRGSRRVRVVVVGPQGAEGALDARADLYDTASGRALLATLPWARRQRVIAELGLPAPGVWAGVRTAQDLRDELAAIRRAGGAETRRASGVVGFALLIPDGEGGWATISAHRQGEDPGLRSGLQRLARQVARRLTN